MQITKTMMAVVLLIGWANLAIATPPFQVLRTCMDTKPYNDKITLTMLEGEGTAGKSLEGCEDQYDRLVEGHAFGTLTCHDKFYLVINDKKIDPKLAANLSINPEIKPGTFFTPRSLWYKIDFEERNYLCILAPLSEQGVGAAYNQYYLVENAFDINLSPKLYFYFLDKNVVPITSKTL